MVRELRLSTNEIGEQMFKVTALDRCGREQLRASLRGILEESGIPTLLVTHDGHEALCLGDRFLMMEAGSLRPHPASDLQAYV